MFNRRSMLKRSGLIALAPSVPMFLTRCAEAAAAAENSRRKLVIIQLDGGNDGINTVVPFDDEGYAKHRKELRLAKDRLIKVDDQVGLHPAMREAGELLSDGKFAIVQGVGYPNPNRSHFRSMAIWHTARFEESEHNSYGWAGRALDGGKRTVGADAIFVGEEKLPLALRGRRSVATSMLNADDLKLSLPVGQTQGKAKESQSDIAAFVQRTVTDAYSASAQLAEATKTSVASTNYPNSRLAQRMRLISQLIKSDSPTRIYYTIQGGYDTHSVQLPTHFRLLRTFSSALKAFVDDLQTARLLDQVVVMAFSEFGRRVKENGSIGTDHGTAGPVFLAGSKVKAGLHGKSPSLTDLQDGDLRMQVDFRSIYSDLLANWLHLSPANTVGSKFRASTSLVAD
jgi:uncharacterized protein (DUF1501 family)